MDYSSQESTLLLFPGLSGSKIRSKPTKTRNAMEMVERRFSWLAVVTIVLVSISVYTCSFLAGVALGRALERRNNLHPSSINGAVDDDTVHTDRSSLKFSQIKDLSDLEYIVNCRSWPCCRGEDGRRWWGRRLGHGVDPVGGMISA